MTQLFKPHPLTAPFRPGELLFPNRNAGFLMISGSTHCSASPHLCQMTVQYSVASVTIRQPVCVASGWGLQSLTREDLQRDPFISLRATCSVQGWY